ncbi:MAG: N-acetylmuramoyl-L-alanine amidase [Oscillibacter sp.]|nr:N-acetylmuramoyl-L-alanine amidase [Oscillibacter sp.]MBD5169478.1 N-acetylmuramoyl-L-alanine amidase [Oscillibacter sp.]
MFITFKKWTALYVATILGLFLVFAAILWQGSAVNASKNLELEQGEPFILVIDPGHGGFDPGAVAADGTAESQINLAIGLQMEEIARLLGIETDMTRREDVSTESDPSAAIRQRKNSDLQNRVAQVNDISGGVLVSLHQNSLPQVPSVHGAQVFYSESAGSQELAEAVQAALNETINDRAKEVKAAGSGVYLLKKAELPAILVECGFLSNGEETALLNTQDYQTRLALTILASVLEHLSQPE